MNLMRTLQGASFILAISLLVACGTTVAAQSQTALAGRATTKAKKAANASPLSESGDVVTKYPDEVLGQWEPGPQPCRLPLTYDSDAGFKIIPGLLQGFEHTNTPKRVQVISSPPQAWRIESLKQFDEDRLAVIDIFVLSGDYLTVTDGQRSSTYRKCHQY
jgi:hypothetical protein